MTPSLSYSSDVGNSEGDEALGPFVALTSVFLFHTAMLQRYYLAEPKKLSRILVSSYV